MRATRAYLASLGTTGLLVLAAVAVLLTASTLVAFNGWPGENAADEAAPVVVDPGAGDEPATPSGPEQVASTAAGAADSVGVVQGDGDDLAGGGGPGGGDAPGGGTPGGESPGDGAEPGPPARGRPNTPTDPAPPSGEPAPEPAPPPPVPPTVSQAPSLLDGIADGVESATTFLGSDALSQLSPALGDVVTGTGQAVTDIVRGLDGTPARR